MRRSLDPRRHVTPGQVAYEDPLEEEFTRLTVQVTDEITWQMRSLGLTRADLAARMGVSPGRVSQVLSGGENMTLRTLAGLAAAVGGRFEVQWHSDDENLAGQPDSESQRKTAGQPSNGQHQHTEPAAGPVAGGPGTFVQHVVNR
jgi:transcriptional regulator with XRE-family HTH domain